MERKAFIDALFARAAAAGFEAWEAYYSAADSFSTQVLNGEILKYSVCDSMGLGFRALVNGRMGYASTQVLDEAAIDLLIDSVRENAALIESEDPQFIHEGGDTYAELKLQNPALSEITAARKIAMARELEQLVLAADSRVAQVNGCNIISEDETCAIVNSRGLDVSLNRNVLGGYVSVVVREGEKVNTGFEMFCAADPSEINLQSVADRAVRKAVDGLNADTVPSGEKRILLNPDAATSLLSTFSGVFSAENAQRGMSLLKGREGTRIAAECVTILDNPHLPGSASSTPFDGEGVATQPRKIVEKGTLTTLLHNLKTAAKQGVATTGNAARGSYSSPVSIAPTNFYFEPTARTVDDMLALLGDGLLITDVQGLHAGANPISGDFSLSAKGYRVEGGKIAGAVHQMTIAGNFYKLLESIEAVGGDLEFSFPSVSRFGSPSLLVPALSVAGA